jgi:hypothetical protein
LPEDGLVRPKFVAIECDFNGILKRMRDCEGFWVAVETEMSERVTNQSNRTLKYYLNVNLF